jgi:hypothetical protein
VYQAADHQAYLQIGLVDQQAAALVCVLSIVLTIPADYTSGAHRQHVAAMRERARLCTGRSPVTLSDAGLDQQP